MVWNAMILFVFTQICRGCLRSVSEVSQKIIANQLVPKLQNKMQTMCNSKYALHRSPDKSLIEMVRDKGSSPLPQNSFETQC